MTDHKVDSRTTTPANRQPRQGAQVTEITHLINLDPWPEGTRLIVRRERPHPGAQLSLFDTIEGLRHTAFITDTQGSNLAALDLRHRRRGRAEQVIRDTKACGLAKLPFDSAANNDRWMQLTFCANDLLCWARRISLTGPLRQATPKTIRHQRLHIAAHLSPTAFASTPPGPGLPTSSTPSAVSSDEQAAVSHPDVDQAQAQHLAATQPAQHHGLHHRPIAVGAKRAEQGPHLLRG